MQIVTRTDDLVKYLNNWHFLGYGKQCKPEMVILEKYQNNWNVFGLGVKCKPELVILVKLLNNRQDVWL